MPTTSWASTLASIAIQLPVFIIAFSFHEFSHAVVAYLLGDNTGKRQGRLTLNPLSHLDPTGLICLLIFHFGWANPVPFNQHNFRHPRFYTILVALAGPVSNIVLAILALLGIKLLGCFALTPNIMLTCTQLLASLAQVNIMLATFNIIPIPPLDGSHILTTFLIDRWPHVLGWIYRYSFFILLLMFIFPTTNHLLGKAINLVYTALYSLVF